MLTQIYNYLIINKMDLIQKASKLGYKHYTEFTVEELDKLPLKNLKKQIEYYFIHKWLRENHNIDVVIIPERYKDGVNYVVQAQKFDLTSDPETNLNFCIEGSYWFNDNHDYPTYEDAMEKGLQEALKLIK